jgi:DNA-binding response OmpR family regulator
MPHSAQSVDVASGHDLGQRRLGSILVIEDDPDIAEVIRLHLEDAQYEARVASDGRVGLERALGEHVDLVVLDLSLPGLDGLDVCRALVSRRPRPLILMVTARATELDRVRGLELGADDYLSKPFSILELVARVHALFRRPPLAVPAAQEEAAHLFAAGTLVLDRWERSALLDGHRMELTGREFQLLLWFVRHPHRVFSRSELLDAVWGHTYDGFEHTVNSHLNRLRSKLEPDPSRPRILVTVRGGGYKFLPPERTSPPVAQS